MRASLRYSDKTIPLPLRWGDDFLKRTATAATCCDSKLENPVAAQEVPQRLFGNNKRYYIATVTATVGTALIVLQQISVCHIVKIITSFYRNGIHPWILAIQLRSFHRVTPYANTNKKFCSIMYCSIGFIHPWFTRIVASCPSKSNLKQTKDDTKF